MIYFEYPAEHSGRIKEFELLIEEAHKKGLEVIIQLAKTHMKENPDITKFIMGMGLYGFYGKHIHDTMKCPKLDRFMHHYDAFKFSGTAITIDKKLNVKYL